MSLLRWAIFGLLVLPLAEIVVFVVVALNIGFLAAVALMILTSMAGMAVIRSAGTGSVARVRTAFGDRVITRTELDGAGFFTVIAGALLVIPGFITDVVGALLLLPITRHAIHAALRRGLSRAERTARRASGRPDVVDLSPDQWRQVPNEKLPHRPSGGQD